MPMARWLAQGSKDEPWVGFEVNPANGQSQGYTGRKASDKDGDNWSMKAEQGSTKDK